jgi:hypothetical protein
MKTRGAIPGGRYKGPFEIAPIKLALLDQSSSDTARRARGFWQLCLWKKNFPVQNSGNREW